MNPVQGKALTGFLAPAGLLTPTAHWLQWKCRRRVPPERQTPRQGRGWRVAGSATLRWVPPARSPPFASGFHAAERDCSSPSTSGRPGAAAAPVWVKRRKAAEDAPQMPVLLPPCAHTSLFRTMIWLGRSLGSRSGKRLWLRSRGADRGTRLWNSGDPVRLPRVRGAWVPPATPATNCPATGRSARAAREWRHSGGFPGCSQAAPPGNSSSSLGKSGSRPRSIALHTV